MEYCTQHRWEEVGEYEVDLELKDLLVVTDMHGIQHSLLRGQALIRQRARTPEPGPPVSIAAAPEESDVLAECENEPIPEIVDAIVASPGIARITRKFKRNGFAVIRISQEDVITEGELHEGRLIRCRVAPPDPDGSLYNAQEIEIYQDLTAQAEEK
jgi:hypothetical protein